MKKAFYLLLMSITIFSCDQEESIQDNENLVSLEDTKNFIYSTDFLNTSFVQLEGLGDGDILRGWSWDGSNYSYMSFENGVTTLHIGEFNDFPKNKLELNTPSKSMKFGNGDDIRGWSWDGVTASYVSYAKKRSSLYIRKFDGKTFASDYEKIPLKTIIGIQDILRGWSWDGVTARYIVHLYGQNILRERPFDGKKFGPIDSSEPIDISFLGITGLNSDGVRSWSYNINSFKRPSYHLFNTSLGENENRLVIEKSFEQ